MNTKQICFWGILLVSLMATYEYLVQSNITPSFLCTLPSLVYHETKLRIATGSNTLAQMPEKIVGKNILLTKLHTNDRTRLAKLYANKESASSFFVRNGVYLGPSQDPHAFVNTQLIQQCFGSLILYVVTKPPTNNAPAEFMGVIGAEVSNVFKNECTILGMALTQYWGTGNANQSTALFLETFFKHSPWTSILASTSPHNSRSHSFLLKGGFAFSHIAQEHLVTNELVFRLKKTDLLKEDKKEKNS